MKREKRKNIDIVLSTNIVPHLCAEAPSELHRISVSLPSNDMVIAVVWLGLNRGDEVENGAI